MRTGGPAPHAPPSVTYEDPVRGITHSASLKLLRLPTTALTPAHFTLPLQLTQNFTDVQRYPNTRHITMETISNIASSASKLIYGDPKVEQSGQEPVSGQTGRGTADEPYDAGNLEGKSAILVSLFCRIRRTSPVECAISLKLEICAWIALLGIASCICLSTVWRTFKHGFVRRPCTPYNSPALFTVLLCSNKRNINVQSTY